MSNQILYISPGGIGEVEFDDDWFQTESTEIYMDKAIPLLHLISNLMSLIERYHRNLARIGRYENYPETAKIWFARLMMPWQMIPCTFMSFA